MQLYIIGVLGLTLTRHVETTILMTYCGSKDGKQSSTTTCSGFGVKSGSKIGGKTPFFDPLK